MSKENMSNVPTPEGFIPEYRRWETKVDQQTGKEVGFTDPEGNFHKLDEGENFSIERDRERNTYEVIISDSKGNKTIIKSGKLSD